MTVGIVLGSALALSFWADPAQRWHRKPYLPDRALKYGEAWVWPGRNIDERIFRKRFAELQPAPDVAIFGSSRAMLLSSEHFDVKYVENLTESGATLEDYAIGWQILKNEGKIPARVVIAADLWSFQGKRQQTRWNELVKIFTLFKKDAGAREGWWGTLPMVGTLASAAVRSHFLFDDILDLLSFQTIQASGSFAKAVFWDKASEAVVPRAATPASFEIASVSSVPAAARGTGWDGRYIYPASAVLIPTPEKGRANGVAFIKELDGTDLYNLRDYVIDAEAIKLMSLLLRDITAAGSSVIVLCLPYHPYVYPAMLENPSINAALPIFRSAIRKAIADSRQNVEFCDALDPTRVGCSETEFIDGMHPLVSCTAKTAEYCRLKSR